MDKQKLNNEIILCRPAVRQAKVAVIRKILKKMKILKSCKNEALKEKKIKKSERLFEKVQIMKRLKEDDVTKFALRNENVEKCLKDIPANLRENALASLAKHSAIVKKVNAIREQLPDWKTELPLLLDSLGKKASKKGNKTKTEKKTKNKNSELTTEKSDDKVSTSTNESSNVKSNKLKVKTTKLNNKKVVNGKKKKVEVKLEESDNEEDEEEKSEEEEEEEEVSSVEDASDNEVKEEKIDDPFFVDKKVIVPKLIKESQVKPFSEKSEKNRFKKESNNSMFNMRPFKARKEPIRQRFGNNVRNVMPDEKREKETLHPSWAAKKVKLIKPFQGKKIKFSED